jgi:hypothetical protein
MKQPPERLIKRLFWDRQCPDIEEWCKLVGGTISEYQGMSRHALLARMLERWSWNELREYAIDVLPDLLSDQTLQLVSIEPIRSKYERLRQLL